MAANLNPSKITSVADLSTKLLPISVIVLLPHENQIDDLMLKYRWAAEIVIGGAAARKQPRLIVVDQPQPISDFAAARNRAAAAASQPWWLFIDQDETLNASPVQLAKLLLQPVGYSFSRQDIFLAKKLNYGETGNYDVVRLIPANQGLWQRPVHEYLLTSLPISKTDLTITHHSHQSWSEFLTKINHYSSLEAEYRHQLNKLETPFLILVKPILKFIQNYVWRQGWRDGWPGFGYALMMSVHSLAVRVKLFEKQNKTK